MHGHTTPSSAPSEWLHGHWPAGFSPPSALIYGTHARQHGSTQHIHNETTEAIISRHGHGMLQETTNGLSESKQMQAKHE